MGEAPEPDGQGEDDMRGIGWGIAALALVVGLSSGQAIAATWDRPELSVVVYNKNDNQVGVDLLDTLTFDFTQQNVMVAAPGTINLGQFPTVSGWSDLSMGAFGGQFVNPDVEEWFVTTKPTAPGVRQNSIISFNTINGQSKSGMASADPGNTGISILSSVSSPLSYWKVADSKTTPGQYGGFNVDWQDGEAVLSALDAPGGKGYQDMYLYHFHIVDLVPGATTDYTGVLRLNADGSVLINPATVPEPTSMILIGSSILGLVGLRRKIFA